jgi:hypothetical protein
MQTGWRTADARSRLKPPITQEGTPAKADNRTRSKWSRVLRYVVAYKPESEPLDQFIRRKGGINECAARFTRYLGQAERRSASG